MGNKIILSSLMLFSLLHAQEVTADKPTIEDLIKEIQKLKESIKELKAAQKENSSYIEEVDEHVEKTETRLLQDKLKFGLDFKTNLDNFSKKYASGRVVKNNNIWSNKLMLNAKADITDSMKFYARLSMYKYWGSSYVHPYSSYDNMQGRVPADSSIYVERAYLDWFFNKDGILPFAVTIGRQPSGDGPSFQFKDNTMRKATYSALLYDGAADGIVTTFNLSKVLKYKKTYLRFGYAKGFGYAETANDVGNAYIGASNNDLKDTNVYGIFLDTRVPYLHNSLVQVSYSKMKDIIANPLDGSAMTNKNLGDMDIYGAMVEITNLKNMNLDLFAHYGYIKTDPNSNTYLRYGGLLNSPGSSASKSGDAIWLGARYGFGEKAKYKVGLEYNHGSKNWVSLTQGSFDVYNKLATRGDAYEAYVMYVANRYVNIRLGYIKIDYDYTRSGWFVGEPLPLNILSPSADYDLKSLESAYLKMNVNF
jgi:hypothetical protein